MRIPQTPPKLNEIIGRLSSPQRWFELFRLITSPMVRGYYLHWDELKFRKPPEGCSHEEWWLGLRMHRDIGSRAIPLKDTRGVAFQFCVPDLVTDLLHQIDRGGGTVVEIPEEVTSKENRDRYLVRSLMEESITSSQLEGAGTTREVAKRMLEEGRKPRDQGERMIANNFLAMQRIKEARECDLTPELVFEIHRVISTDTLDIVDGAGRFRRANEEINVSNMEGKVFHTPPAAQELPDRLQAMCDFANAKTPTFFIHPVVRGIILHFWLAYDHPFVDGNGRAARALFYWQMLHSRYWLFEFISISQFLRKAPVQYGTAFLHTETDANDLTYFIIHQAEIIRRSLRELHDFVARKSAETRACFDALRQHPQLNHRQQALISHAVRHPRFSYKIAAHGTRHAISYATARSDLLELSKMGLLEHRKVGRSFVFIAPTDLEVRLRTAK